MAATNMSRLPIICPRLQSQVMILRSFSRTSQCCVRGFDPRKGIAEDGDYDPHYESYTKRDYNKPVKGNYSESFSGPTQMAKLMDGQKVFEGFPLANKVGIWDYKHMPRTLKQTEFDYPLSEDRFGQRYPGFWIKEKFRYVKEMEPELIVPDLTDFPLKPYVSYRANELETPELTARALFNLVYADGIYKKFLAGEDVEGDEESVDEMIEKGEQARSEAEKTGSDRFVPNSWYGIGVDKFD